MKKKTKTLLRTCSYFILLSSFVGNHGIATEQDDQRLPDKKFAQIPMLFEPSLEKTSSLPVEYTPNNKNSVNVESSTVSKGLSVAELMHNLERGKKIKEGIAQLEDYASNTNIEAVKALAGIYEDNRIVDQNLQKSFQYWHLAADEGDREAQFKVGEYYQQGKGTSIDLVKAIRYYGFSSRQGYEKAIQAFEEMKMSKGDDKKQEMVQVVEQVMEENQIIAASSSALTIPDFARGHEAIYHRFVNGKLVFDNGQGQRREFPFMQFKDTLEGEFDLTGLKAEGYDVSQYLSINLGYRRGKNPAHKDKVEVWILPQFLMDRDKDGPAHHYQSTLRGKWESDVGILWTWGNWQKDDGDCDYVINKKFDEINNNNLLKLWHTFAYRIMRVEPVGPMHRAWRGFVLYFN